MGAKKFSHTHRSTMCGLKKLASGVFPESWKVLAELRRQRRRKRTKNNKSPGYPGWLTEELNWKWFDQFRSVQAFNSKSNPIQNFSIQFQFNSCWIDLIIHSNSIHELIRVQGAVSIRKTVLPGMVIPMLKIRRPNGRLIFNMEIAIRR